MTIKALLSPRSVAVLGASERASVGRGIVDALERIGFPGAIYPVNPKYATVAGRNCYASLHELPEPPDVVSFCIRNDGVVEGMRAAAERGAHAAVIYDGGFAEVGGGGEAMQTAITGICREAGIALCGPNCMGVLNPPARSTTFKQEVRNPQALIGNVALISQSGSIAASLLADLRRFGFSVVVSSGNEAVNDTASYIEFAIDDPNTKVIATFTETVRNPDRYIAALDRAADKGKPVIVLKVGRSERVRAAITGHTGGLAGESRVFSEVLKAHRAIEVEDLDEMTEVLAACQGRRWPKGHGINVVTTSGGQAELILDVATAAGISLNPMPPEVRAAVERDVGRVTGDGNPLDAWGRGDFRTTTPQALRLLSDNPTTDAVVFCSSDSVDNQALGRPGREEDYARLFAEAASKSTKPHYFMTMRPGVMHSGQLRILKEAGVAVIGGSRQGLGAIERLARWNIPLARERASTLAPLPDLAAARLGERMAEPQVLYETDGKVGIVTLNRPNKLNALSMELRLEMERVLRSADDEANTSVIVLRAEGRSFCVGFDVGADGYDPGKVPWRYDALKLHQRLGISVRTLMTPWTLRKPVIASVQGHALGGGCELAMFCDLTIAADNAVFGEPEMLFSHLGPAVVMPMIIGHKRARELLYFGDTIDAKTALSYGMVNRVVPLEELRAATMKYAKRMTLIAPEALAAAKLAVNRGAEAAGFRNALQAGLDVCAPLYAATTEVGKEFEEIRSRDGLKAALAWRRAQFKDD